MARVLPFAVSSSSAPIPTLTPPDLLQLMNDLQVLVLARPVAFDMLAELANELAAEVRETYADYAMQQ